jgi:hypothetical protein
VAFSPVMREVAVHEAGHSVIARVLGLSAGRATLCDYDGVARTYFSNGGGINSFLAILAGRDGSSAWVCRRLRLLGR